jgi:hypothetical protein
MEAVSPLWAETVVAFSRSAPISTPGGGFDRSSGASSIYLVANCHVELQEVTSPAASMGGEVLVMAKWWLILLPIVIDDIPLDPTNYPRKGDRLRFTDDLGRSISMDIRSVESPETVADHFEILTVTFE